MEKKRPALLVIKQHAQAHTLLLHADLPQFHIVAHEQIDQALEWMDRQAPATVEVILLGVKLGQDLRPIDSLDGVPALCAHSSMSPQGVIIMWTIFSEDKATLDAVYASQVHALLSTTRRDKIKEDLDAILAKLRQGATWVAFTEKGEDVQWTPRKAAGPEKADRPWWKFW